MEMAHVRYFLALCEEGSFTRAARRCGVAQPSLTRGIKVLERELGGPLFQRRRGPLFQRRRNGAQLTELGVCVEPYFAAIARCAEEIKRASTRVSARDRRMAVDIARRLGIAGIRRNGGAASAR
jgi:DNA-binding transcriptional LysR family regulator